MQCLRVLRLLCGVCGTVNNSKVVGVVFVGGDKVVHDDDRLVCGCGG